MVHLPDEGSLVMATIPYSPIGEQRRAPTTGTEYRNNAGNNPDAFGAGVGQAMQGLGRSIEGVADMAAKHAYHMQDLTNQASAKEMFLEAGNELGKVTEAFNVLEGKKSAEAYDTYVKDVMGLRQKWRDKAPNAEVARIFDNDFVRRAGFSIQDGGRRAATETRQWMKGQATAIIENSIKGAADRSLDDDYIEKEVLPEVIKNANYMGEVGGWSEEQTKAFRDKAVSAAIATRLESAARIDPFRTKELFAKNKDKMTPDMQNRVEDKINQSVIIVGSKVKGDELFSAAGGYRIAVNDAKKDTYWGDPDSPSFAAENLVEAVTAGGKKFQVNRKVADRFTGFLNELEQRGYNIKEVQGHNNRKIFGTNVTSQHAFGNAIDLNPGDNGEGTAGNLPPDISQLAAKYGLSWGGDWKSRSKDPMHFEASADDPAARATRYENALKSAREEAKKQFPDQPGLQVQYETALQQRVQTNYSMVKRETQDKMHMDRMTLMSSVLGEGSNITSPDQLPAAAYQVYTDPDNWPLRQQADQAMKANATRDVPLTPERQARFTEIYGTAQLEPDKFINMDLTQVDLPRAQRAQLQKLQIDRKKLLEGSAETTRLISSPVVAAQLNDAQIFLSKDNTQANQKYTAFAGAFMISKAAHEAATGKPITPKEAGEITSKLLRDAVLSKGWLWDTKVPVYEAIADKKPIPVTTEEEVLALPPGTAFIPPDGKVRYTR